MPRPRSEQVSLEATRYYHLTARCVRRAYLCGRDPETGENYGHRRQWLRARLATLVDCFAVDLCSYSIMTNHYHLLIHANPERAKSWTDREVAGRWLQLFKGPLPVRRWINGEELTEAENLNAREYITLWRNRLCDISWFMKCLNEYIARRANREDQCTGKFWEERFSSQALLDDPAVIGCMTYIDLNPVRAGLARTPEESDYTSVQQRIDEMRSGSFSSASTIQQRPRIAPLAPSIDSVSAKAGPLAYPLTDYLELVDWTGRAVRADKRGAIQADIPHILERLKVTPRRWVQHMGAPPKPQPIAMGGTSAIHRYSRLTRRCWIKYRRTALSFCPG